MKSIVRGFLFQISGMLLIQVLISSCSCNTVPEVTIVTVTNVSGEFYEYIECEGKVTDEGVGNCNCSSSGFCWSKQHLPTLDDSEISAEISETGSFTFSLTSNELESNTEYYIRAWARNDHGVSYSNEVTVNLSPYDGDLPPGDGPNPPWGHGVY